MSERRVTNIVEQVEVSYPKQRRATNVVAQVEASYPPERRVTNIVSQVEVGIPTVDITPEWITGFEHGVGSANGGGLFSTFQAGCSIVSAPVHSGNYACRVNTAAGTAYFDKAITATGVLVTRFYINPATLADVDNSDIFLGLATTNNAYLRYKASTGKLYVAQVGGVEVESTIQLQANFWAMVELRCKWNATTHTIEWKINGVTQTTYSIGGQVSETFNTVRFGVLSNAATADYCIDDIVVTGTSQDYPVGPGGTVALKPNADGTHSAGVNVLERQDGSDIGAGNPAWNVLNKIPISDTSTYVRQVAIGASNYVELRFEDLNIPNNRGILGAMAVLAYASAGADPNTAGCIVSERSNFSKYATVHGNPSALADYSDGDTSNPYYKSTIILAATNVIKVNDLRARLGYAGDATPNVYWFNVILEIAYVYNVEGVTFSRQLALSHGDGHVVTSWGTMPYPAADSPTLGEVAFGEEIESDELIFPNVSVALALGEPYSVGVSGSGDGKALSISCADGYVSTSAETSGAVVGTSNASGNIETFGQTQAESLSQAQAMGFVQTLSTAEGVTRSLSSAISNVETFGQGNGFMQAQALPSGHIATSSQGESASLTLQRGDSLVSVLGSARECSLSSEQGDGNYEIVATAFAVANTGSLPDCFVETFADSFSLAATYMPALGHVELSGFGESLGLSQCEGVGWLSIDPDVVRGKMYTRTAITGKMYVRTAIQDEVFTRSGLRGKGVTRTSTTGKVHARTSNRSKTYTRTSVRKEEEL